MMFTSTFNHHRCLRLVQSRRFHSLGAAAALAMALALGLGVQPAFATGEDIQVVSEEQTVKFPDEVDFDLTVESAAEITEVRLFFRPLGSRIWTYAYPSFEPGKRVTANLKVNTTGGSYLPPGARLEYYYLIRDAAGNVLETRPSIFEFTDHRFQWKQTQIGPLILTYHDLPASQVSEVEQQVSDALERLIDLLRTTPEATPEASWEVPVQGVIYNNRNEALEAFPFQSETISESGVFQGFAFSSYGIFVGIGLEPRLIVHETAHLLLHQALGSQAPDLPAWLNEGFASHVEPGSVSYGSKGLRDQGLPLRAMSKVSGSPSHIGTFYLKSESVVGFLVEYRGTPAFQQLLERLRGGQPVDEALMLVYGFDTDGLEALWAAEADGPQAPSPSLPSRPSPYLYLDAWVFGGIALLVFFMLSTRSAYRWMRRQASSEGILSPLEEAEGVSPFDGPGRGPGRVR